MDQVIRWSINGGLYAAVRYALHTYYIECIGAGRANTIQTAFWRGPRSVIGSGSQPKPVAVYILSSLVRRLSYTSSIRRDGVVNRYPMKQAAWRERAHEMRQKIALYWSAWCVVNWWKWSELMSRSRKYSSYIYMSSDLHVKVRMNMIMITYVLMVSRMSMYVIIVSFTVRLST